jgi:hypothetical protein
MSETKLIKIWDKPLIYKLNVLNTQAGCDPLKIVEGTDGLFDGTAACNAYS